MAKRRARPVARGVVVLAFASVASGPVEAARQPGKDLAFAAPGAGTIVNQYAALSADTTPGATAITLAAPAGVCTLSPAALAPNDLLLVIQMQGATIDTSDAVSYGSITALNSAGRFEYATVRSVAGATVTLDDMGLRYAYSAAGRTQVIRVPQYTTLSVPGGTSITAPAWDGACGGVAAVDVQGTATIDGSVTVSALGFRGGALVSPPGTSLARNEGYRMAVATAGAEKGEGIAGPAATYDGLNGRYGRGAPANGGGGGNNYNAPGGGGANAASAGSWWISPVLGGQGVMDGTVVGAAAWALDPAYIANGNALSTSVGGGRGGYACSTNDANALLVGPLDSAWGCAQGANATSRAPIGGLGGRPLANRPDTGRLFFGGGGGSGQGDNGDQSNGVSGVGGRGGGIVLLSAATVAGAGTIQSNGEAGGDAVAPAPPPPAPSADAPGGGGAGGSLVVRARSLGGVTLLANGGPGGNQVAPVSGDAGGGGGGGGGGFIAATGGSVPRSAAGGAGGTTNQPELAEFPTNGATRGGPGIASGEGSCLVPNPSVLTFTNVTSASGLGTGGTKEGGVAWGDFNQDGCLDAAVNTADGTLASRVYLQAASAGACGGTFTDVTACLFPGMTAVQERSVVWGDYDNDGRLDLARNAFGTLEVYRSNGPGIAVGAACGAGVPWTVFGTAGGPTYSLAPGNAEGLAFVDYGGDGDLDLLLENGDQPWLKILNNPTGTLSLGPAAPGGSGNGDYSAAADYDGDGDVDFFARQDDGRNLWWNDGAGNLILNSNFAPAPPTATNANKGGAAFCDLDDDGDLDLFWTDGGSSTNRIWRNNGGQDGAATFTELAVPTLAPAPSGGELVDGVSCQDLDNDGDLDLVLTNGAQDYLLRNDGGFAFTDVTPAGFGTGDGEGVAVGDYDRDGDMDVLVNQTPTNELWRNETNDREYLMVRPLWDVDGVPGGTTREAIGATARLLDCSLAPVSGRRHLDGGHGHGSQDGPNAIHFGLRGIGGFGRLRVVEVRFVDTIVRRKAVFPSSLGCYQELEIRSTDADDIGLCTATAVRLMSFAAAPAERAVDLSWQTGSELDNAGFHLYRSPSADGPWTRLTSTLIPGLGSSPLGRVYSWRDSGLANGQRYYYRLEDVDTRGVVTSHGPVSAVPGSAAAPSAEPAPAPTASPSSGGPEAEPPAGAAWSACPAWVRRAALEQRPEAEPSPVGCTVHGRPEETSLQVRSREERHVDLELLTGGFYAVHEADGTAHLFVPGFEASTLADGSSLPFRRAVVEAVVGRQVRLASVRALDVRSYSLLQPASLGRPYVRVGRDGTVRGVRARGASAPGRTVGSPRSWARVAGSAFQGEDKRAIVELAPLSDDGRRLLLARRLAVRVVFTGHEPRESGRGRRGRVKPPRVRPADAVLAVLHTRARGLHAVAFEALFPAGSPSLRVRDLRLSRRGAAQPFRVEPAGDAFGPGGALYFFADRGPDSLAFAPEVAWELARGSGGVTMATGSASPSGAAAAAPLGFASLEQNRFYQPGLLDAEDLWLWESLGGGTAKTLGFELPGADPASPESASLEVLLEGGTEAQGAPDHHVRVLVNGVAAGEAEWDGRAPNRLRATIPASVLRASGNELQVVNVGDRSPGSMVFLDRFTLRFPQAASVRAGALEAEWATGGTAVVSGLSGPPAVVDVTSAGAPRWLLGASFAGATALLQVEPGRRYVVAAREGVSAPRIEAARATSLRNPANQADYVVIAPAAFFAAAEPLLQRRRAQGLAVRSASLEDIAAAFGHGEPSAAAVRDFLTFAFQSWARPSPRYVLLLGDSTYDPRGFVPLGSPSPLPALWHKTTYLWTVSDPGLARVNGDDELPDLAIGRLPASTAEEAARLVAKVLDWEDSGQGLGGRAVLVADNPDVGGDFEANVEDIAASFLAGRQTRVLRLSELLGATRGAIRSAFDEGLSLMSYVGHGGAAVWASENVWSTFDAPSLLAQPRQGVVTAINCLNGYLVAPRFDALAESLVKAEGRGAIAAIAPSSLSLDDPAHRLHRALYAELALGRHERLGDAVLAAQKAYAESGALPELLTVYHLFGDPALRIR